tara:strand:- start:25 stop:306 length:282 start_codon:yes stop_codon:yes gene_type:complete
MKTNNLENTLDLETQLRHSKQAIEELTLENNLQKEQLILYSVVKSLPIKKYNIDFSNHLRCGLDITADGINIIGAIDGWGNDVSKEAIIITEM